MLYGLFQRFGGVRHDGQAARRGAMPLGQRLQRPSVAVADLARLDLLVDLDYFVAGWQDRDRGARVGRDLGDAHRTQHADIRRVYDAARVNDHVPNRHVAAGAPHVLARRRGSEHAHRPPGRPLAVDG